MTAEEFNEKYKDFSRKHNRKKIIKHNVKRDRGY
jgi:hypothetical protein